MRSDTFTKTCTGPFFEKHASQIVGVDECMTPRPETHKGRVSEVGCEFLEAVFGTEDSKDSWDRTSGLCLPSYPVEKYQRASQGVTDVVLYSVLFCLRKLKLYITLLGYLGFNSRASGALQQGIDGYGGTETEDYEPFCFDHGFGIILLRELGAVDQVS